MTHILRHIRQWVLVNIWNFKVLMVVLAVKQLELKFQYLRRNSVQSAIM